MHFLDDLGIFNRGVPAVRPTPLALEPELTRIVEDFQQLPAGSKVRVARRLDPSVRANVDPGALRQIVLNLLENAAKYGAGSDITLGLQQENGAAQVWVEDGGGGIPGEDMERIWHPFTRGTGGQSAGQSGSGIGLAVVRALAEAHGGSAEAVNREQGCRFTVTLPLSSNGSHPA